LYFTTCMLFIFPLLVTKFLYMVLHNTLFPTLFCRNIIICSRVKAFKAALPTPPGPALLRFGGTIEMGKATLTH